MNDSTRAPGKRPRAYFHKVKNQKHGFQRQNGEAVRARSRVSSKAKYAADPTTAKAINAAWAKANPEKRREYVRKHRAANKDKVNAGKRASWKRNRTPEKLERMRQYSRAWRLRRKQGDGSAPSLPQP